MSMQINVHLVSDEIDLIDLAEISMQKVSEGYTDVYEVMDHIMFSTAPIEQNFHQQIVNAAYNDESFVLIEELMINIIE